MLRLHYHKDKSSAIESISFNKICSVYCSFEEDYDLKFLSILLHICFKHSVFSLSIVMLQPYLHECRHLHAKRREGGCGGRFINKKKPDTTAASTLPDTHTSSYETVLRNVNNSSSSRSRPFNFFRESDSPRSNGEATEPLHQTHPNQTYSSSGCNLQFPWYHISKFHWLSEKMAGERDRNVNKLL